ncbi:hypothetical protein ACHQM5_030171 [Ranunculus cassubicifolius]
MFDNIAGGDSTSLKQEISDFKVGVVLDLDSAIGKVGWNCIELALSDFYARHPDYRTRLSIHLRNSQGDNVKASLAVLNLLQNVEVQAIIGPQTSTVAGMIMDFGDKAHVPILSFSATNPSLSSRTPYFFRAAHSDSSQMKAITAIIQTFKWREVVTINEDSDYGNGGISFLIEALQEEQVKQVRVSYKSVISLLATDDKIRLELYKLMNMPYRVFIVHMSYSLGFRLFLLAKELGMMSEGYVWIVTDGLMNFLSSMENTVLTSMQGVLGVKAYVEKSPQLDNFTDRWRRKYGQDLNVYGLWAYDTVWTLAMAAERVSVAESSSRNPRTISNLTDLTSIKTTKTGQELLDVISKTRFKGLSGDFYFVSGQLQADKFQILNMVGEEGKVVGFWNSEHGISKELNLRSDTTSVSNLRGITWPGDTLTVSKGWVIPTRGKKLRIAVRLRTGSDGFVKLDRDVYTNQTTVSGYTIDVFNLAMEELPYPVAYELEPFVKEDGTSAGSFSDLVHQVNLQRYDVVVGDISITANRSEYFDFTLPYAEGGFAMMVPVKHVNKKSAWIFFRPLTRGLWLTSGAFFILTGLVIWVLEHRVNEAFRGPPSQHFGMILWFPLSTIVFAHRERIVSNLTRCVVIVWIFVVLILNSSYTASLSAILTVESLQPAVTSIEELTKNGDYVGYPEGCYIPDLLKHLIDESKFKPFKSAEHMHGALQKGSQNGGIAAFIDAVPYIKLNMAKYCNEYMMVGPIHKTEGIGFGFPRGSPMVADVSRALMKVQESSKMKDLDRALFGIQIACLATEHSANSKSLDLSSFRGLFFITGAVSGLAFLVFLAIFLYKNKPVLTAMDPNQGIWTNLKIISKVFDEKDYSSYRFRREKTVKVCDMEASPSITSISDIIDMEPSPSFPSTPIHSDGTHHPPNDITSTDVDDHDMVLDSIVVEEFHIVDLRHTLSSTSLERVI